MCEGRSRAQRLRRRRRALGYGAAWVSVGGRGDHLIEKLYRDQKAMDIVEGTGQIQRIIMARKLVGLPR